MVVVAKNVGFCWDGLEVIPTAITCDRVVSMLVVKGTLSEERGTIAMAYNHARGG